MSTTNDKVSSLKGKQNYVVFYHDDLSIRGGAEVTLQYLLRFFEECVELPYLVLTLSEINTFPYIHELAKLRQNRFHSLKTAINNSRRVLYKRLFYLLKAFYNIKREYGKPKVLLITKGGYQPQYLGLFGYVFKNVEIKILCLPDVHELNILKGYSPIIHDKDKFSLLPAKFLIRTLSKLYNFNKIWLPYVSPEIEDAYIAIVSIAEVIIAAVLIYKIFSLLFKGIFCFVSSKPKAVVYSGGFRRRFERVNADIKVEYRFNKETKYCTGVCKDISLHGMKLEIKNETPEVHQRLEIVIDGKKLKLKTKERVKIGGFVVRVVHKKGGLCDIGVEFYHLFRPQAELIAVSYTHLTLPTN